MTVTAVILLTIIAIVQILKFLLMTPKPKTDIVCIIPLSGKIDNIEFILRSLRSQIIWDKALNKKIILLNINIHPETLEICQNFCKTYSEFSLMQKDDISSFSNLFQSR